MDTLFFICLPTFLALLFVIKEPKPRIYTFSFLAKEFFISEKKVYIVTKTSTLGTPVFSAIVLTKSAFLITLIYSVLCLLNGKSGAQSSENTFDNESWGYIFLFSSCIYNSLEV